MAKKKAARRRGRPRAENPKSIQLNVRIDETLRDALDRYRANAELEDLSDATRHLLRRTLRDQGFLKEREPAGSSRLRKGHLSQPAAQRERHSPEDRADG